MAQDIRTKFIQFYEKRGHIAIPSASLVPENDSSTLFTSSGMQPLLPYFLGTPHPQGRRITDCQKCFRSVDIEEVGDKRHTTFFEMLGNWSFGDYFKAEQLPQVWEFFTKICGLDPQKLYVTVFGGDQSLGLSADTEAVAIWQKLFAQAGIEAKVGERIFVFEARHNWWSRSGTPDKMPTGEPGGGDSEVFYDFGVGRLPVETISNDNNDADGRLVEIGNSVFMQYVKTDEGKFADLPEKNVDYGGGLERLVMAVEKCDDIFQTSLFAPLIQVLETATGQKYADLPEETKRSYRIIADHCRSGVMIASEGVVPSNKEQGYVLRRLLRRSIVAAHQLDLPAEVIAQLVAPVCDFYGETYPDVAAKKAEIEQIFTTEARKFSATLNKGLKMLAKLTEISGEQAFFLYESFGFPLELTQEIAAKRGIQVDEAAFQAAREAHRQASKLKTDQKFRGGLADHEAQTVKFHTATHLLLAALRAKFGTDVYQKGSNITGERARFDFTFGRALTEAEIAELQQQVNAWIEADLPVSCQTYDKQAALQLVGGSVFADRYPDRVTVYQVGDVSQEICVGPHVSHTGEIGRIKITKQQSAGSGVRRLYVYFA